jgi:hypothetical protein
MMKIMPYTYILETTGFKIKKRLQKSVSSLDIALMLNDNL